MVILIQLCVFIIALLLRGRALMGKHLKPDDETDTLQYIYQHKGRINARAIGISLTNGQTFIVKPEKWYHRLFKAMGIASEIKMPDSNFDSRYFISSDFPGHLEQAMRSGTQKHLQDLFALPVKSLHALPDRIWCVIDKPDLKKDQSYFAAHRSILRAIAAATRKTQYPTSPGRSARALWMMALVFVCVHAGLLSLGILGAPATWFDSIDIVDTDLWLGKSLLIGGVVAAVWFFLILNFFRGSSWICWVMMDFMLCGIIGFLSSAFFIVRDVNVTMPQELPTLYQQRVLHKSCVLKCKQSCGKHCTRRSEYTLDTETQCSYDTRKPSVESLRQRDSICRSHAELEYRVTLEGWKERGDYWFDANERQFDESHVGGTLQIPVHKGALGLEWVDTSQIRH